MCPIDIPEGYEFVEVVGASYVEPCHVSHCTSQRITITIQKAWVWPEWLKAGWIAMDSDGFWYMYEMRPQITSATWQNHGGTMINLSDKFFDFTPPYCSDWQLSLHRNPKFVKLET